MSSPACPDSSFVLKLLLREPFSDIAVAIAQDWAAQDRQIVAPGLLAYEVTSVLRTSIYRQRLTADEAEARLREFFDLPTAFYSGYGLHRGALRMANSLGLGAAYDTHYVSLSLDLDAELFTADRGMRNAARSAGVPVTYLGPD